MFRGALAELSVGSEFSNKMKRGPEVAPPELYAFSTDTAIKYQLVPEEREFLKKLHLEDFVASVQWGVLHSKLVTEAMASLEPKTWITTMKGNNIPLIATNWREQYEQVFHLSVKKANQVTTKWQLHELFPKLQEDADNPKAVRIADCQYPGARRPLRLLSSLLCLNTSNQHNIATSFAEHVLDALNGQTVDWPQEFHREMMAEMVTLHNTNSAPKVKMQKTSIGPHVTLILKATGVLKIREELEAGYRSPKAFTLEEQTPHPKMKKPRGAQEPQTSAVEVDPTPQPDQTPVTQVYTFTPQTTTQSATPKVGVILETSESWQPPNPLPTMVDQICQVHRRLENLLTSFTTKAPQKLVKRMNQEFFKIQRTSTLHQNLEQPTNDNSEVLLKAQDLQLKQLTRQLDNSDSLNDISIEAIFLLEEESATLHDKLEYAQNEVYSLQGQKGEALAKLTQLQEKFASQTQLTEIKQKEIDRLTACVADMWRVARRQEDFITHQREERLKLESQVTHNRQKIARLKEDNQDLTAKLAVKVTIPPTHTNSETQGTSEDPTIPILNKEKHTLAAGVSNQLLNELRRDLNSAQQENHQLKRQLARQEVETDEGVVSQSSIHPKSEVYHQIISHTEPPKSVMQCHRAYGGLNLLLSGLSLLQAGCRLDSAQAKQIWDKVDAPAKDIIAFMWCLNEIKLPIGTMEVLSACPPFYIKRYVLRCIKLLGQHPKKPEILKEPLPTLRSYSHGQYHLIKALQKSKSDWFQHALKTLAAEDITVCYEVVKMYQEMANQHEHLNLLPTVSQLKQFATKTFDEQQLTLSKKRFGTISSGTLLIPPREHTQPQLDEEESIGTCFL